MISSERNTHMTYKFVEVTTVFGEYESVSTFLVSGDFTTLTDDELKHKLARNERGSKENDWDEDLGFYWFDGYGVTLPTVDDVSSSDVEVLKQYLSVIPLDSEL